MSLYALLNTLDRAHNGPVCTVKDWDARVIPTKVSEKLKKYGLLKTCDRDNPINTDDALANEFFKAGFELAVDVGMLCQETERVIKISEEELREGIEYAPATLVVGQGLDRVLIKHRRPEDATKPVFTAPLGIVVSEEIWVPLMQGIAQQREIDIFQGGSLATVWGRPVLGGTPYETLVGRVEAQMNREALWRAGRPGMPTTAVISSTTVFGQLGGYGIPGGYDPAKDIALVLAPAELKVTYASLHKAVHAHSCGGVIRAASPSMIGGYAGPPEGAAIAAIAYTMLQYAVYHNHYGGGSVYDVRYLGNCGREGQWAIGLVNQALSRNTHLLTDPITEQVAGPCTEMILYESAVGMMNLSVSGASGSVGPRSAGGKYADHLTPLESKFCAEVFKACAGMKRAQANEIAKVLIPKYEARLKEPPKGQSFRDCYDLNTLEPTTEWLDLYLRVKRELSELGIPLTHSF